MVMQAPRGSLVLSSQADACLCIPKLHDAALSFRAKPDECQPMRAIARSLPGAGGLTVPVVGE